MFHGHQKLESVEKAKNGESKYFLNIALIFKNPFLTLKHWEESFGGGGGVEPRSSCTAVQ